MCGLKRHQEIEEKQKFEFFSCCSCKSTLILDTGPSGAHATPFLPNQQANITHMDHNLWLCWIAQTFDGRQT